MKRFITFLMIATATALLFGKPAKQEETAAYAFEAEDLDGNKISSGLYSDNKITMINIWGTFCGPCIREMPDLAKLSEENKDKGVEIIGIPIDLLDDFGKVNPSKKADALMIINKTGVKYKNVVPNIDMIQGFLHDIQVVPTTIFVDKNGKQIGNAYLGSRSQKDWQKIINKLLQSQN